MKYRFTLTERKSPSETVLELPLAGRRVTFTRKPDTSKGQTDTHVLDLPPSEEWRIPGLRDDGFDVEEEAPPRAPAPPKFTTMPEPAPAPKES